MWRYASHHDGRFIEDDDHDDTVKLIFLSGQF